MGVPALLIGLWSAFRGVTSRGEERSTSAGGTGGTTAAATRTFEEEGIRRAVHRAMRACAERSAELGKVSSD